jgi:hypothetical protein
MLMSIDTRVPVRETDGFVDVASNLVECAQRADFRQVAGGHRQETAIGQ